MPHTDLFFPKSHFLLHCLLDAISLRIPWDWTFQRTGRPKAREGARFLLVTLAAIVCNDLIVWLISKILLPVHLNPTLWTNSSKVAAIGGTILVSYLGMRLWVFVQSSHEKRERFVHPRTSGSRHFFPAKSGGKNVVTP